MKYGIDVCSYQGNIDWKKVKGAGCTFAVLKCIRKDLNPDKAFSRNVAGCEAQKIPADAYTYVYEGDVKGARKRAEAALKACKAQGLKSCTIWWDVEDPCIRKVSTSKNKKNALHESILAAKKVIEGAGYGFGIYCDVDFRASCLYPEKLSVRWWLASYGANPVTAFGTAPSRKKPSVSGALWGWQYCSRGRVPGISGSVDLDVVYGAASAQETPKQDGNPYPEPTGTVTSTAQAAAKGLQRWIPQGAQVKWVQWELQRLGYDLGASGVDGKCGAMTTRAIQTFQMEAGLTVDGLCGAKTRAALAAAKTRPAVTIPEAPDFRARVAAKAQAIYPLCIGKVHGGKGVNLVVSLSMLKAGKALSCNRMVSIVLQEAGLLPKGCIVAHTAKAGGKRCIADAVSGYGKLRHCKLHWVNCLYKDLPEKWKKAGVVYFQNSNACISAGGGKIWSCNKSKGEKYRKEGDYLRTGGYPFNSKILVVCVPEE